MEVRAIERRRDRGRAPPSRAGTGCRRGRAAARSRWSRAPAGGRRPRAPCAATGTPAGSRGPRCDTQCASSTTNRDTPTPPHASRRNTRNSGSAMRSGVVSSSLPPGERTSASTSRRCLTVSVESTLHGADALGDHLVELILDQRDQRADHDRDAGHDQRGQLVEQRLAAAGRHHREQVFAGEQVLERLGLAGAECLDAERALADPEQRADLAGQALGLGRDRTVEAVRLRRGRARRWRRWFDRDLARCRGALGASLLHGSRLDRRFPDRLGAAHGALGLCSCRAASRCTGGRAGSTSGFLLLGRSWTFGRGHPMSFFTLTASPAESRSRPEGATRSILKPGPLRVD